MNDFPPPSKIRELSVADRLRLIEEVWLSQSANSEAIPVPDWRREELDKRLAARELADEAKPWDAAKGEILAKLTG